MSELSLPFSSNSRAGDANVSSDQTKTTSDKVLLDSGGTPSSSWIQQSSNVKLFASYNNANFASNAKVNDPSPDSATSDDDLFENEQSPSSHLPNASDFEAACNVTRQYWGAFKNFDLRQEMKKHLLWIVRKTFPARDCWKEVEDDTLILFVMCSALSLICDESAAVTVMAEVARRLTNLDQDHETEQDIPADEWAIIVKASFVLPISDLLNFHGLSSLIVSVSSLESKTELDMSQPTTSELRLHENNAEQGLDMLTTKDFVEAILCIHSLLQGYFDDIFVLGHRKAMSLAALVLSITKLNASIVGSNVTVDGWSSVEPKRRIVIKLVDNVHQGLLVAYQERRDIPLLTARLPQVLQAHTISELELLAFSGAHAVSIQSPKHLVEWAKPAFVHDTNLWCFLEKAMETEMISVAVLEHLSELLHQVLEDLKVRSKAQAISTKDSKRIGAHYLLIYKATRLLNGQISPPSNYKEISQYSLVCRQVEYMAKQHGCQALLHDHKIIHDLEQYLENLLYCKGSSSQDMVQDLLGKVLSRPAITAVKSTRSTQDILLHIHSPIAQFVRSGLDYDMSKVLPGQNLDKVFTITEGKQGTIATTAGQYLRSSFPGWDSKMLTLFEKIILGDPRDTKDDKPSLRLNFEAKGTIEIRGSLVESSTPTSDSSTVEPSPKYKIAIRGPSQLVSDAVQQVAWIIACFRSSAAGHEEPCHSSINFRWRFSTEGPNDHTIEQDTKTAFNLCVNDLDILNAERIVNNEDRCWLPLVPHCVISQGFDVPQRTFGGRGLEIPFSLLAQLATIRYPIWSFGRPYLRGSSYVLYPTDIEKTEKTVQWHLLSQESEQNMLKQSTPSSFPKTSLRPWIECDDLGPLVTASRTFVGYARRAFVHLGTETSDNALERVRPSGAKVEAPLPGFKFKNLSFGTSGMGIFGFGVRFDALFPRGLQANLKHAGSPRLLSSARSTPVMLFDNQDRRAWLVSSLGAALHMAHIWAKEERDVKPLPIVDPEGDPEEAVYELLKSNEDEIIQDFPEKKTLRGIMEDILTRFDQLREMDEVTSVEKQDRISWQPPMIYG